jgi:hypothetical protein
MAPQGKFTPIAGKVQKDKANRKKFKILKSDHPQEIEVDVDIEVVADGDYQVERLTLPDASIKFYDGKSPDGISIRWFTNFSIKENGNNIKKPYRVTIPGLAAKLAERNSQLVVYYGSGSPVAITSNGDSFDLTDGDPSPGSAP